MNSSRLSIAILLLLFLVPVAIGLSENIEIVKEDVSPQSVEPGKDLVVSISIWNRGDEADGLSVGLVEDFPFILRSSSQDLKSFSLCAGCKISNTYRLTIDHKAVSGIYKLKFFVKQGDTGIKREIDIDVKGKSDIVFESSDMTGDITPNSEFSVTLNVRNEGEGVARNIKLVSSSRDFLLKGTDIVSIEEIQSGALREIALTFLAGSSVEKGVYSLPINIQYEDHDGTVHETTQKISVKVIDKAKLSIKDVKIEPSKIRPGDDITVQVRIENVGDGDANNIKMTLESEIEGSKESYIGRLEKDDDSPAFISGTVLSPGEKSDTLVITYEDDLGIHTMNASVNYTVKGVSNSAYIIVGLIVVILALAGILVLTWVYRVCKCAAKGHKCPSFKNHVHKTIENATSAFKK